MFGEKRVIEQYIFEKYYKNVYIPNNVELDEFKKISTEVLNDGYNIIIFQQVQGLLRAKT